MTLAQEKKINFLIPKSAFIILNSIFLRITFKIY